MKCGAGFMGFQAFNLFEHLIVLHVFLGSFVSTFSLSLQSGAGADGRGQLVYQSDDSPHDTVRKQQQSSVSQDTLPAAMSFMSINAYSHRKSEKPEM